MHCDNKFPGYLRLPSVLVQFATPRRDLPSECTRWSVVQRHHPLTGLNKAKDALLAAAAAPAVPLNVVDAT